MPPEVIDEHSIFIFKFWFNDALRYGMYNKNELFCRLGLYPIEARARIYQLACKLSQQKVVMIVTCTSKTCSLWGSLRSPLIKQYLIRASQPTLPSPQPLNQESNHTVAG